MLIFMPTICFAKETSDSVILERIWSYRRNYAHKIEGGNTNSYMRYTLNTERRNFTLFLVPTLYAVAKGDREYISESYGKLEMEDRHKYSMKPQVISSTISHNRQVSDAFMEYLTPNIYDVTIYDEKILSPFHRYNRIYYRYKIAHDGTNLTRVSFRPKLKNTQLIKGYAIVDSNTGRVVYTSYDGEFNMLQFHIDVVQGAEGTNSVFPQRCKSDLKFYFLGNRINSHFLTTYHAPTTLPDSLREVEDHQRMDSLRTIQLRVGEQEIYQKYFERKEQEKNDLVEDSGKHHHALKHLLLDVGDLLVTSSHAKTGGASFSLSPILNPQYISYSHSRGFSYKIQLGAQYNWNKKRYLSIKPQIGYNFGIKQFYHYTPVRMTYNPKRHGYAEIVFANGNRISNSSILQVIKEQYGDDVEDYKDYDLDYFTDNYIKAYNNVVAYDWLEIKAGLVYHIRKPVNISGMEEFNQPIDYRSFAPMLTLHISPWRRGPYLTLNYERSFKNIFKSTSEYERIEFDVSHKFHLLGLRTINLKGGLGLYTNSKTTYFLDYANFRDENLPGGWEDEWTGNFQLLNSQWYNTSKYYLRLNTSYESPLLAFSFLPWIGKFIERERFYFSTLSIQHTRAYSEIGYSISTRFLSVGAFASFLNTKSRDFGFKFTFELFREW